jgi:hypothetical protein
MTKLMEKKVKNDRQYNDQTNGKKTINDRQNSTQETKIEQNEPH